MTKKEIELLKKLLEREDVKGKRCLKEFIWFNTVEPKYKVGDVVKFSNRRVYHYGCNPIEWVGTITNICYCRLDCSYQYEITYKSQIKNNNYK